MLRHRQNDVSSDPDVENTRKIRQNDTMKYVHLIHKTYNAVQKKIDIASPKLRNKRRRAAAENTATAATSAVDVQALNVRYVYIGNR